MLTDQITRSAEETVQLGQAFARTLKSGDCVVLVGDLGTGKTTFVQGVAEGLHVDITVSSPTYLIVQEYAGNIPLFHMDAYRLNSADDLFEIGFEEYLHAGGVVIIEWGDRIKEALPDHSQWIYFETQPDQSHLITFRASQNADEVDSSSA
jgi:tRNA threonylcarbamoyladenosine biosynthesis protein TsaE